MTTETTTRDCYYIRVEWTRTTQAYFKSDKYSVFEGSLRVEFSPEEAKAYKTQAGARKAIDRLVSTGIIKGHHKPVVVRVVERKIVQENVVEEC